MIRIPFVTLMATATMASMVVAQDGQLTQSGRTNSVKNDLAEKQEQAKERARELMNNPASRAALEELMRRRRAGETVSLSDPNGLNTIVVGPAVRKERTTETIKLAVEGQRPLLDFAEALQRQTGVPISYEDPIWAWDDDSVRYADIPPEKLKGEGAVRMQQARPDARLPQRGVIEVVFNVYSDTKLPVGDLHASVGKILQRGLEDHKKHDNPGVFRILDLGENGFSIVPEKVRDAQGGWLDVSSPLDVSISFPEEMRSPQTTFALAAKKIGDESGLTLGALSDFSQGQGVRLGAKADQARDVLIKLFNSTSWADPRAAQGVNGLTPKRTWQLLYNIELGTYILYSKVVTRQVQTASGPGTPELVRVPPPLPESVQQRLQERRATKVAAESTNKTETKELFPSTEQGPTVK